MTTEYDGYTRYESRETIHQEVTRLRQENVELSAQLAWYRDAYRISHVTLNGVPMMESYLKNEHAYTYAISWEVETWKAHLFAIEVSIWAREELKGDWFIIVDPAAEKTIRPTKGCYYVELQMKDEKDLVHAKLKWEQDNHERRASL